MNYTDSEYEGEREEGRMQGQGAFKFRNGSHYTGGFKDNEFQGEGVIEFQNQSMLN